jgi:hypothetical protein
MSIQCKPVYVTKTELSLFCRYSSMTMTIESSRSFFERLIFCSCLGTRLFSMTKSKLLVIFFLSLGLIFCSIVVMRDKRHLPLMNLIKARHMDKNELDGCGHVYIDMGTNIGIQIRKLYQPHLYPRAPVLPLFKEVFGNSSKDVCSVGFEANPVHDDYLKEFEQFCHQQNWRVKIFTSVAVSIEERNETFYVEPKNNVNNQWGASLYQGKHTGSVTIPTINIISYVQNIVLKRQIPLSLTSPKILIKSDIEGHDSVVLANLILNGVYCSIDCIYGEHFDRQFQNSISFLQKYSRSCPTKLIYLDDETYHDQRFPFTNDNANT